MEIETIQQQTEPPDTKNKDNPKDLRYDISPVLRESEKLG